MFAPTALPWLFAWSSCSTRSVAAERGDREAGDVAGREHVVAAADAAERVDDDAVRDRQARLGGQLDVRLDPEPGDDGVGLERAPVTERHPARRRCRSPRRPETISTPCSR